MTMKQMVKDFFFKEQQSQCYLIAQWMFAIWLGWALLTIPIILNLMQKSWIDTLPGYTPYVMPELLMSMYSSAVNYAVPTFMIYLLIASITDGLLPGTRRFMSRFRNGTCDNPP